MTRRRRHHKTERLSPEARRIVDDGLGAGATYDAIAFKVFEVTGEKIGDSSVQRYAAAKWLPAREAAREADAVAERIVDRLQNLGHLDAASLREAMKLTAAEELFPVLRGLAADDPASLARFFSSLDQNRIGEARLDVDRRKIDVDLARVEARNREIEIKAREAEAKIERVRQETEEALRPGRERTREDLERTIRDLYGIAAPAGAEEAAA